MHTDARMLIAVRVVAVTTLLLATLIIQYTVRELLPINYLYTTAGVTYGLTLAYIGFGKLFTSRKLNLVIQISGDLVVETVLVYFTGGLDSPFSFLYLVSIITASMLLYRRGGLLAASGAVILYGGLGDLMYYGVLPLPEQSWFVPTPWSSSRLYFNMATNFAGFYATAFLTSYLAEKLQKTFEELDANRQNLAELRALNQNVVESIPSGLITLSPEGIVTFINPAGCFILHQDAQSVIGRKIEHASQLHRGSGLRLHADLPGPHRHEEARSRASIERPHGRRRRAVRRHRARDPKSSRGHRRLGSGAQEIDSAQSAGTAADVDHPQRVRAPE